MLEVRLAGGLALRTEGGEIAPPASKRARAVLAYLALNPGPQQRGRLAARFWPDVLDESARASLRVALTELRQALGPAAGSVLATRDTIALDGPDLQVDARAFQQALDKAIPFERSRHAAPRSSTASRKSGRTRHVMSTSIGSARRSSRPRCSPTIPERQSG